MDTHSIANRAHKNMLERIGSSTKIAKANAFAHGVKLMLSNAETVEKRLMLPTETKL